MSLEAAVKITAGSGLPTIALSTYPADISEHMPNTKLRLQPIEQLKRSELEWPSRR
jgi:hypothetical protein